MSQALGDITLVETVYDSVGEKCRFARQAGGGVEYRETIDLDGIRYSPVRPRNYLVRHRALLFPSETSSCGPIEELLAEIEEYVVRYLVLPPDKRRPATAYVILSWLYDAFRELPYLRLRGDYGTVKTRALGPVTK